MPFVIHDSDGVRPLLLWEGQLKRMSHHPRLLVFSSDQFYVLTFGDDVLQSVPLLFWDGISQAPTVPEARVRPGATIPTPLTSV